MYIVSAEYLLYQAEELGVHLIMVYNEVPSVSKAKRRPWLIKKD